MPEEKDSDEDQPQGVPIHYVNHVNIEASAYDFRLNLGIKSGQQEPQITSVAIMSPQHAKSLYKSLERVVNSYEAEMGELPYNEPGGVEMQKPQEDEE